MSSQLRKHDISSAILVTVLEVLESEELCFRMKRNWPSFHVSTRLTIGKGLACGYVVPPPGVPPPFDSPQPRRYDPFA